MHFNNDVVILAFGVLFAIGFCLFLAGWGIYKLFTLGGKKNGSRTEER